MTTLTSNSVLTIKNVLDTPYVKEMRVWRNSPNVRCNMLDNTEISEEKHIAYIASLKKRGDRRVFIVEDNGFPLIVLNVSMDYENEVMNLGWFGVNREELAPMYSVYAFYVVCDWLFKKHPRFHLEDVVLMENKSVWSFIEKCGFRLGQPRAQVLNSGKSVFVRDAYCDFEMWDKGSKKLRPFYERVLKKAAFAQSEIPW